MGHSLGSTATRLLVAVCVVGAMALATGLSAQASAARSHVEARAAKTVSLAETGHLKLEPKMERGSAIGERGQGTGTYNAPVEAYLTFHAHYLTVEVTVYPKGGSISGYAQAEYHTSGGVGSFKGTLRVTHGTGTYRHISGTAAFRGGINTFSYNCWFQANGRGSY
jgi:hypothetical protein